MASFDTNKGAYNNNQENLPFYNRVLRNIGSWGMDISPMLFRNSVAKGINEPKNSFAGVDSYKIFSEQALSMIMDKKTIPYFDKSYTDKRNILREYSKKNEINKFVQTIVNEAIVYDDKKFFCHPVDLINSYSDNIKERLFSVFNNIYTAFDLNDGRKALKLFTQFIVDGNLAFEIIYDDKRKNIIGFKMLDPAYLVPALDPLTLQQIWIQNPDDMSGRTILLDVQVIFISFSDSTSGDTSYVEPLIRPYNLYRIIEETIVMFRLTHATMYKKFVVPTDGMSKAQSEEAISSLMAAYEDDVVFDSATGQISINGKANIPYSKEVWFPAANGQSPTIDLVETNGPNLLETDTIVYFYNALKRASGIPLTRLDQANPGGGTPFQEVNEVTREELMFARYIDVLRSSFIEILIKPLWIQMILEFPELKDRKDFKADLGIKFNKDNLYEEWKILTNLDKKAVIISNLLNNLKENNPDSFFEPEFLIPKFLGLNSLDLQENAKIKALKKANNPSASTEEAPAGF